MKYNLTEKQKDLARWIVQQHGTGVISETLYFAWNFEGIRPNALIIWPSGVPMVHAVERAALEALQAESLVRLAEDPNCPAPLGMPLKPDWERGAVRCTITARLRKAVETNFSEEEPAPPISTLAQPHPPEISLSIDRLRANRAMW